jgi:glyoxylase I family protein
MKPVIYGLAPLLHVFDMKASIHFYCDIVGFTIIDKSEGEDFGWALLGLRSAELMLNAAYDICDRPPVPDPARLHNHADTAIFFGCEDLNTLYDHFRKHGLALEKPCRTGYDFMLLSVKDPDGYQLHFHWPATQEAYDQWVKRYGFEQKKFTPNVGL